MIRLGDGTAESRRRMEAALELLAPYTGELFRMADFESAAFTVDPATLREAWDEKVNAVFTEAGLSMPQSTWHQSGGKKGIHTEHLGYLLSEMQYLQRTYPDVTW